MSQISRILSHRKIGIFWLSTGLPQWLESMGASPIDMERFFFGLRGIAAIGFQKILKITQEDQQQGILSLPWRKHGLVLNLSGQTNPKIGLQSCDLQKVTASVGFGCPHGELVRPLAYRDFQILTAEDRRYESIALADFGITRFERGRLANLPTAPVEPKGKILSPAVPVLPGLTREEIDKELSNFKEEETVPKVSLTRTRTRRTKVA